MSHRVVRQRIPEVDELWCERSPRRAGKSPRCVNIISVTKTHAYVENIHTGRKSRIMLSKFTRGVLTGWYRRYPSITRSSSTQVRTEVENREL